MCVLRVVLIFWNILPCKPNSHLFFLIVFCGFLATIHFFKIIFFLRFLWVADIVRAQNCFVFIFPNLKQIEEKTHVPVTIRFPDYIFNKNIHSMYCFHGWDVSLTNFFYDTQKLNYMSLLSLEKKRNLCLCDFR